MAPHPYTQYLDASGNIDPRRVVMTAIRKARSIRACEKRVSDNWTLTRGKPFRFSTPRELAKEALADVTERAQAAHHAVVVVPAYRASLDPVEREIREHEQEIYLLRDKLLGSNAFTRRQIIADINGREARIAELRAPMAEAAE